MWKEFNKVTNSCLISVPKAKEFAFKSFCNTNNINIVERVNDVKKLIDENLKYVGKYGSFDYNAYNRFNDVSF